MKLTTSAALSALCWTARLVSAGTGHVYIYNPHSSDKQAESRSLSPDLARIVFAQRAGVEDYHGANVHDSEVIDAINDFGTRASLLREDKQKYNYAEYKPKAFIVVEGITHPEGMT